MARGLSLSSPAGAPPDVTAIYRAHGDFAYAMLARLGVRSADRADALQDVLVVVHRKLPTWNGEAKLTSWLFGICLRVAAQYRRKAHVRRETLVDDVDRPSDAAAPEDRLDADRARARLLRALDGMDLERRAIFVMYELEERTTSEIAEEIDIPLGTVHSRLHAARAEFTRRVARVEARDAHEAMVRRRGAR